VHNPRIDEEMQRESESLTRGAPIEARAEEFREMEEADDEIVSGSLRQDAVRERSELARHLRGSIFPAERAAIVRCAIEEHAPEDLIDALRRLPDDEVFVNVEAVWEALGGTRERRTRDDPHAEESRVDAPEPERAEPEEAPESQPERPLEEFRFRFDLVHRLAAAPFLVSPGAASVVIDRARRALVARFGPWTVETALANVEYATTTGPYHPLKTVGPPHVSLSDRGLTFATNDREGLCIRFRVPVRGIDPLGVVRHPAITVTVDDVDGLRAALAR